jgi:hypothetical protein
MITLPQDPSPEFIPDTTSSLPETINKSSSPPKHLIALISIFLLVATITTFYLIHQSPTLTPPKPPQPKTYPTPYETSQQESLDSSTADWQTHTSSFGYSFKYPSFFELKTQSWQQQTQQGLITHEINENIEAIIIYEDPIERRGGGQLLYYTLQITIHKPVDNPQGLTSLQFAKLDFPESQYGNEVQFESVSISGEEATKVTFFGNYLYIPHNQQVYKFVYTNGAPDINTPSEYETLSNKEIESLVSQILSTFKFNEPIQNSIENWQVFNDPDMGFTFRYPPGANIAYTANIKRQFAVVHGDEDDEHSFNLWFGYSANRPADLNAYVKTQFDKESANPEMTVLQIPTNYQNNQIQGLTYTIEHTQTTGITSQGIYTQSPITNELLSIGIIMVPWEDNRYEPTISQILSTFKFIE